MYLFFYPYELIFIYAHIGWIIKKKQSTHIHITFLVTSFIKFHFFFFKHLTATYHVLKYTSVYVKNYPLFTEFSGSRLKNCFISAIQELYYYLFSIIPEFLELIFIVSVDSFFAKMYLSRYWLMHMIVK